MIEYMCFMHKCQVENINYIALILFINFSFYFNCLLNMILVRIPPKRFLPFFQPPFEK